MSLAEARQVLKQGQDGKNLYNHLVETLMKIILDRPQNAYDMFELISAEVKVNPLNPEAEINKSIPSSPEEIAKQLAWALTCSKLLKVPLPALLLSSDLPHSVIDPVATRRST
jgi:hypothetical protein